MNSDFDLSAEMDGALATTSRNVTVSRALWQDIYDINESHPGEVSPAMAMIVARLTASIYKLELELQRIQGLDE